MPVGLDLLAGEVNVPRGSCIVGLSSVCWRCITFIHTTWKRFQNAQKINELCIEGGEYMDRLYCVKKERGILLEFDFKICEPDASYETLMTVTCLESPVHIRSNKINRSPLPMNKPVEEIQREENLKGEQVC